MNVVWPVTMLFGSVIRLGLHRRYPRRDRGGLGDRGDVDRGRLQPVRRGVRTRQYFAIAPMRGLSLGAGLKAATKADTLSITAWQVGMYGLMAVLRFAVLSPLFGAPASVFTPEFWFVMQLAMLADFATAYPVDLLLIRRGVKERM